MCKKHCLPDPCWRCEREQRVCKKKIRFSTWFEADEWTLEYNESHNYVKPVVKYKCRWCKGWHMTTAKSNGTKRNRGRSLKKAKRKWLIEKELERRKNV